MLRRQRLLSRRLMGLLLLLGHAWNAGGKVRVVRLIFTLREHTEPEGYTSSSGFQEPQHNVGFVMNCKLTMEEEMSVASS